MTHKELSEILMRLGFVEGVLMGVAATSDARSGVTDEARDTITEIVALLEQSVEVLN